MLQPLRRPLNPSGPKTLKALGVSLAFMTQNKLVLAGVVVISVYILMAILAPVIAPYDPYRVSVSERFRPPGLKYPMGTDHLGRPVLQQVIHGSRISLQISILSMLLSVVLGVPLGLVSGFFGGWIDNVIMRCVDILFAFPALLLAIAVVAFLGGGTYNVMLAIGVVGTAIMSRVTRSAVIAVKEEEYVLAARALGESNLSILIRQVLPNAHGPIVVQATLRLAEGILYDAALSFIGLGAPPPTPSWGRMISEARGFIRLAPWTALGPGIAIMLLVLAFNFVGDGIRDVLDPRLVKRERV